MSYQPKSDFVPPDIQQFIGDLHVTDKGKVSVNVNIWKAKGRKEAEKMIDFRRFYLTRDGSWIPTGKGFSIPYDKENALSLLEIAQTLCGKFGISVSKQSKSGTRNSDLVELDDTDEVEDFESIDDDDDDDIDGILPPLEDDDEVEDDEPVATRPKKQPMKPASQPSKAPAAKGFNKIRVVDPVLDDLDDDDDVDIDDDDIEIDEPPPPPKKKKLVTDRKPIPSSKLLRPKAR